MKISAHFDYKLKWLTPRIDAKSAVFQCRVLVEAQQV